MISGYGIHSGKFTKVFFHLSDGKVKFLKNKTYIPANLSSVVATPRCTVLGKDNQNIAVVEHLLAALHALNYWSGLIIEVDGDELPILDGSAQLWFDALKDFAPSPPAQKAIKIAKVIEYKNADTHIKITPGKQSLNITVDYNHPAIGKQYWQGTQANYVNLMPARTFGFLKEAQALQAAGLATRANLENVIIFDDEGAMQELRFKNEVARHKALDAVGDFYLLGQPLEAKVEICRGSHESHIAFLNLLGQEL